jgi:glycosyltransferase involved in cell wall biosynthesis/thymidylate kinase
MKDMAAHTERILVFRNNDGSTSRAGDIFDKLPLIGGRLKRDLQHRQAIRQMKNAFRQLVLQESYDLVLFHGKDIVSVIEDCNGVPIVVDICDCKSLRILTWMRYAGIAKLPLMVVRYLRARQVEKKLVRKTPYLAFVSSRDREAIPGLSNSAEVVPIGVDQQYWKRKSNPPSSNSIVFAGVMNYPPNEDAAFFLIDKILPLLRCRVSNLKVFIVGVGPSPTLRQRAQYNPEVTVTGFVDDVRPYLERATISVAPIRHGSGTQNKVLEAMAMEVPVVTTSLVVAGLRAEGGEEPPVYVAKGKKEFAECIANLLARGEERARLAVEGRRYVEKHFVWSRSVEKLERMCVAAARANPRGQQRAIKGNRRGFSVALIGGDGAGKSTIARKLEKSFPLPVKSIYMGVKREASNVSLPTSRVVRYLKRARNGRVRAGRTERKGSGKVWAALRLVNFLAEEWYRQMHSWNYQRKNQIVVYDRHFQFDFDYANAETSANGPRFSDWVHRWCLAKLYPRPDLVVFLDAPAEVLLARKGEFNLQWLESRRQAYLRQGKHMANFVRIDATQPLETVYDQVSKRILRFYHLRCSIRSGPNPST